MEANEFTASGQWRLQEKEKTGFFFIVPRMFCSGSRSDPDYPFCLPMQLVLGWFHSLSVPFSSPCLMIPADLLSPYQFQQCIRLISGARLSVAFCIFLFHLTAGVRSSSGFAVFCLSHSQLFVDHGMKHINAFSLLLQLLLLLLPP